MYPTEDTMPRYSTVLLVATAVVLSGCSTGSGSKPTAVAPAPTAEQQAGAEAGGAIALSPGGVTTRMDVPAQSTEEQYAQACMATKDWMATKGGDPHSLIEPYLKDLQGSPTSGPATFNKTWAELEDSQRAAVIIAVRAAADGGC